MASSRKRPPKPDPADAPLLSALQKAVAQARAHATALVWPSPEAAGAALAAPQEAPGAAGNRPRMSARRRPGPAAPAMAQPLLIGFSGGPDSTVLLDLACRLRDAAAPGFALVHAVHVHHGLQPQADEWVAHCEHECRRRQVELTVCRVRVQAQRGLEDGARQARYEAMAQTARRIGAPLLLTAHNADDRIETFLLQWLRGAGPLGLAGIAARRGLPGPGAPVQLVRPLLAIARRQIEDYVQRHELATIADPSNADPRFDRNALRLQVLPALGRIRSGFRRSTARSMDLLVEAAELLQQLALEDLAACTRDAPPRMLRLDRLAALAPARRPLVLRAWLAQCGVATPSQARVHEVLEQALGPGGEGRMLVRIGGEELRRHRGLLCLRQAHRERHPARAGGPFYWSGESELVVSGWGGVLRFFVNDEGGAAGASLRGDAPGFDAQWLRERPLELRARAGGERFKPYPLRPSKTLKHWYQEAGVPEFERAGLPLLWRDDRLIFVPRLGGDARWMEPGAGRVRIEWLGEASLLAG